MPLHIQKEILRKKRITSHNLLLVNRSLGVSLDVKTRIVHGKFNCVNVNFDRTHIIVPVTIYMSQISI